MKTEALEALYQEHIRTVQARYAKALDDSQLDAVIVHSGTPKKRTEFDDQFFPLRPTPEFHLWAPLTDPDCFVVATADGAKTTLVWPQSTSFWERPAPPDATYFMSVLDVRRTAAPDLAALGIGAGKRIAWIGEDTARAATLGIAPEAMNPPRLVAALDQGRVRKTAYEIACLAEANRIASVGHEALRRAFEGGACSELELHLAFLGATRQDDQETPYKNIVALGRNGAVLHHVSYGRDATRAGSMLIDAGACFLGYCSDITRTWTRAANTAGAGATFCALVQAMEAMQQRLVARVAVGMPYEELHDESHRQMSVILKEAGIAKGSAEEIDAKGISRAFYPHGLGHSLGLVTHDVGCASLRPRADNPFLRNTSRIAEDQVFTIEPGLYFIDGLLGPLRARPEAALLEWGLVEALSPFGGIRIEDDIQVLAQGVRNLTREVLPTGAAPL